MWLYLSMSDQSPTANSTPIVKESCSTVYPTDYSLELQYGMISKRCRMMGEIGQESTSFMEVSHARILALQERVKDWKGSEADYSTRSCAWPKKSSPRSYSLKMSQPLQAEGDFKSLERLPKWGMIVDGVLYPLHPLERYTVERDGSYWLTPSTMEHLPVREGEALENAQYRGKNRDSKRKVSGRLNEQVAYPHMWPTPNVSDSLNPNMKDNHDIKRGYLRAVALIATLCASQANKPIRAPSPTRQQGKHGEDLQDSIGRLNPETIGKKLSVPFVESMMAYPTGWTDLEPWATQWFQSRSKKRSES